jgi:DNA-binding transcriptional LysR family regulator
MKATNTLDLNHIDVFIRVVESGSFTAAAIALGLPKSSVSRRVSTLEDGLRVRLLQRSTRTLTLTEAGRLYFERARSALRGLADANTAASEMSQEVAGKIRFTAGGDNTGLMARLLGEFLGRYPKVQLEVELTPRRVDLVAEGFDLALRAGPLVDSSLVVRRIGRTDNGLFASAGYLRRAGTPKKLGDLSRHRFVLFGRPRDRNLLRLTGPKGDENVDIDGPLIVNDMSFLADAICADIGIGLVPELYLGWMAMGARRPRKGTFVRLLPEYGLPGAEISLVSPPTAFEPTRVALLRDFLATKLRPMVQGCAEASKTRARVR